jgi:hypothetical protein
MTREISRKTFLRGAVGEIAAVAPAATGPQAARLRAGSDVVAAMSPAAAQAIAAAASGCRVRRHSAR